jgi:tRNA(Ile)-lysidine synthetase-like protein
MIHILNKLPHTICLAISGGVDSMAIYSFLKGGKRTIIPAFFHHGTETSDKAWKFLRENVEGLVVGHIVGSCPKGRSKEDWWREQRYAFLRSINFPIVTAHHLDDVIETWIFTSLHGNPKLIPYYNNGVIRPFLMNKKSELVDWCKRKSVPWIDDCTNTDTKYARNRIRHNIIPEILKINPGIHKVIKKKIIEAYSE